LKEVWRRWKLDKKAMESNRNRSQGSSLTAETAEEELQNWYQTNAADVS
jgi:hypothetical protein